VLTKDARHGGFRIGIGKQRGGRFADRGMIAGYLRRFEVVEDVRAIEGRTDELVSRPSPPKVFII
jgi:hypothetical protein